MVVKIIIVALVIFMIFNLFKAMMVMLKGDTTQPMSKFLGRRVIMSATIMILLLIGMATGLIEPNQRPY